MTGEFYTQRASNAEKFPFDDVFMRGGAGGGGGGGGGIYIHLLFCLFYTSLKIYDDTCSELEAFYIMYLSYDTTLIGDYLARTPWTTLTNKRNTLVKHPDTVAAGRPQIWVKITVHHM